MIECSINFARPIGEEPILTKKINLELLRIVREGEERELREETLQNVRDNPP